MKSPRPMVSHVKDRVLAYFNQKSLPPERPVLTGQIAMELQCSLKEAESYLEELVDGGAIRELLPNEARTYGISHGYFLTRS